MSLSIDSVRISFRALCSRNWLPESSEQESGKIKELLAELRLFVELPNLGDINNDEEQSFYTMLDEAFINNNTYPWSITTLCISLVEVYVSTVTSFGDSTIQKILSYMSVLLEHQEVRVRSATTDLIKALSTKAFDHNESVYDALTPILMQGLVKDWTRAHTTRETQLGTEKQIQMDDTTGWNHLESYVKALHALFVGMSRCSVGRALQYMQTYSVTVSSELHHNMLHPNTDHITLTKMDTITKSTIPSMSPNTHAANTVSDTVSVDCVELLITHAALHINRHIRELTFRFIVDLLASSASTLSHSGSMPSRGVAPPMHVGYSMFPRPLTAAATVPPPTQPVAPVTPPSHTTTEPPWHTLPALHSTAHRIAEALTSGLQDDWSQIRHAASMACQSFLHSLQHSELLDNYWKDLLPRLCMNRFYPAVAVQTVSQATWRDILGPEALGRRLLAQHSLSVVQHYTAMTQARNHMTAEAACQAIAEYAGKLEHSVVVEHAPLLLTTLAQCVRDARWPVRDAAIVASGVLCRYFASESTTVQLLPSLVQVWTENLTDFIWSVREHAAVAIAEALQCDASTTDSSLATTSTSATNQQTLVFQTALHYIRIHLLYALHPTDIPLTSMMITDPTTASVTSVASSASSPKPYSFLPQSLLDRDAAAKLKLKQEKESSVSSSASSIGSDTITAISTTALHSSLPTTTTPNPTTTTIPTNTTSSAPHEDRKGWGCCIDCIELRTCLSWEVSHGAVYLLREVALVRPSVLWEAYSVSGGDSSDSNASNDNVSSENTLLTKFISLLTEPVYSDTINRSSGGTTGGNITAMAETELLRVAVYDEVHTILSSALQTLNQHTDNRNSDQIPPLLHFLRALFGSLARDLKEAATQDPASSSAPTARYTTTTYLTGSKTPLASSTSSNTTSVSSSGASGTTSTTSAVQRRTQQVARRSARNRDKVVIAAESCMTRVLEILSSAQYRPLVSSTFLTSVHSGSKDSSAHVESSESDLRVVLLANFPEEMQSYISTLMKW